MLALDRAYRIGEVARETGVTVETLRFYERRGLLGTPARTAGGARRYDRRAIERVRFVKRAKALGLTLREVATLVGGTEPASRAGCRRVHAMLRQHIDDIERRVAELRALRQTLVDYRRHCEEALQRHDAPRCPTLDALQPTGRTRRDGGS
jgi:DNA-binding transcriptional MerR regulator